MTNLNRLAAAVAALVALAGAVFAQDLPQLRAALLKTGTVNWEIATIKANGFDTANGFDLLVQDYADNAATRIALEGGEADVVVADWIWVAMMRAEGKDFVFLPYSRAVGSLVVRDDSGIASLSDLKGKKIGVAGGPLDKSWLILRAYAEKQHGMNLAAETEQVFGAPPLIFETALNGELGGAVNFWHFNAKAEAAGMRPLVTVAQAATELGLSPETPLLGYVTTGEFLREHEGLVTGLAAASRQAKDLLATDEAAWDELRPIMNAKSDAQFAALKAGFRAGIPAPGPVDEQAAGAMLALMANLGGEELMGKVTTLPEGVFVQPGS